MKRDPAAYYVQISYFDCILCHQPVRLSEDRPQRLGCGCISMLASGAPSTIVQELDAFSRYGEETDPQNWASASEARRAGATNALSNYEPVVMSGKTDGHERTNLPLTQFVHE